MFPLFLFIHSWTRWGVLIAGIALSYHCISGWRKGSQWSGYDNGLFWAFSQLLMYQAMFGLFIYLGGSPYFKLLIRNPSVALEDPVTFFFSLRHPVSMLLAVGVYFVSKAIAYRKSNLANRHGAYALCMVLTMLIILSAIPWPGLVYGRNWFRFF